MSSRHYKRRNHIIISTDDHLRISCDNGDYKNAGTRFQMGAFFVRCSCVMSFVLYIIYISLSEIVRREITVLRSFLVASDVRAKEINLSVT